MTRLYQAAWALIFLTLALLSLRLNPDPAGHGTHTQLGLPPCPAVLAFNRPCPGCGMTTSFAYSVRGDLINGFRVHPFGPALFLGWGVTAAIAGYAAFRGLRMDTNSPAFQWTLIVFALAFFAYGGYRFYAGF
jgi:hypothetical protein